MTVYRALSLALLALTAVVAAAQTSSGTYTETYTITATQAGTASCSLSDPMTVSCTLAPPLAPNPQILNLAQTFCVTGQPCAAGGPSAPTVQSNTCNITLPVTNGANVTLAGGGNCQYTAKCGSGNCLGGNAVTSWAITAQSLANAFSITSAGILQGGSAAASVTAGIYTVTVTATNATGTSPGVVQTVDAGGIVPVVASKTCTISTPIINGIPVKQTQNAGNCVYTATCGGGSCTGSSAITNWGITTQSCANCYSMASDGTLDGGTNATNVVTETDTVTVTATNSAGTSAGVTQTVNAYADGTPTSPGGTAQFPNLMTSPVNYGANRPPWNIAGVDYAVASIAQITSHCGGSLTDWHTLPTTGSITWSGSGHNVFVSGSNTQVTCYDFSLHGGAQVLINATSPTISWSVLQYGTNAQSSSDISILRQQTGSGLTLINDVIDGNGPGLAGALPQSTLILVDSGVTGTFTLEYCNCENFHQHVLEFNSNATVVYKYNLVYNGGSGIADGSHLNYQQFGNNSGAATSTVAFNTTYQPTTPNNGGEGFQCYANGTGSVSCTFADNTMIYGPGGQGRLNAVPLNATSTTTVNANYIDFGSNAPWTGCNGSLAGNTCTNTGGTVTYTNNIKLTTGVVIPAQ